MPQGGARPSVPWRVPCPASVDSQHFPSAFSFATCLPACSLGGCHQHLPCCDTTSLTTAFTWWVSLPGLPGGVRLPAECQVGAARRPSGHRFSSSLAFDSNFSVIIFLCIFLLPVQRIKPGASRMLHTRSTTGSHPWPAIFSFLSYVVIDVV